MNDTEYSNVLSEHQKREAEKRQRYDRDNALSREKRAQSKLKKTMAVATAADVIDLARPLNIDLQGVLCPSSENMAILVRIHNDVVQFLEVKACSPNEPQAQWVDLPLKDHSRWDKSAWDHVASKRGIPPGGVIVSLTAVTHKRSLGMFGQRSLR